MKTLASFVVVVGLGVTSAVKWFEAPSELLVGEPITIIEIGPQVEAAPEPANSEFSIPEPSIPEPSYSEPADSAPYPGLNSDGSVIRNEGIETQPTAAAPPQDAPVPLASLAGREEPVENDGSPVQQVSAPQDEVPAIASQAESGEPAENPAPPVRQASVPDEVQQEIRALSTTSRVESSVITDQKLQQPEVVSPETSENVGIERPEIPLPVRSPFTLGPNVSATVAGSVLVDQDANAGSAVQGAERAAQIRARQAAAAKAKAKAKDLDPEDWTYEPLGLD